MKSDQEGAAATAGIRCMCSYFFLLQFKYILCCKYLFHTRRIVEYNKKELTKYYNASNGFETIEYETLMRAYQPAVRVISNAYAMQTGHFEHRTKQRYTSIVIRLKFNKIFGPKTELSDDANIYKTKIVDIFYCYCYCAIGLLTLLYCIQTIPISLFLNLSHMILFFKFLQVIQSNIVYT